MNWQVQKAFSACFSVHMAEFANAAFIGPYFRLLSALKQAKTEANLRTTSNQNFKSIVSNLINIMEAGLRLTVLCFAIW